MPVEAGGLVEAVHFACGGFLRFVHCGEVISLFIPGFRVVMGYFLAGFYAKLAASERCPPFFGALCFSVLNCLTQRRKSAKILNYSPLTTLDMPSLISSEPKLIHRLRRLHRLWSFICVNKPLIFQRVSSKID